MLKVKSTELRLVRSDSPLATVEVDIGSIQGQYITFDDLLADGLASFAAKNPTITATLYYYFSGSVNFGEPTDSVFIGIAGPERCLKKVLSVMRSNRGVQARFSDYISPHSAGPSLHIEDGKVFRAEDPLNWYTSNKAEPASNATTPELENDAEVSAGQGPVADVSTGDNSRGSSPSRYRIARSDASVGTIRRTIEEVFGLPEGAVALCGPDGRPLKATAKIATLRKRWE